MVMDSENRADAKCFCKDCEAFREVGFLAGGTQCRDSHFVML